MRAKPSSTNIATALVAIVGAFCLRLGARFRRSRGAHPNLLRPAIVLLLTLLAFSLTPPSSSYAAPLTVCSSGCGYTTIAAAILAASAGDTISITDAVHTEANITVDRNLTIQGQGAANTAVDGGGSGPVFTINGGVTATIQDLTIRNGSDPSFGGPVNFVVGGGGILNYGTVKISNSTLSGNSTGGRDAIRQFHRKARVTVSTGKFSLNSSFTLGAGSNGINPVTEDVTLQIGPYSVTITAGSFTKNKKGAYVFAGTVGGAAVQFRINPVGGNSYTLQATGSGANLTGISNPVTVTLTIGDDTGSTQITAQIS